MIIVYIVLGWLVLFLGVFFYLFLTAPEAYEDDEHGFQYGKRKE